MVTQPSVVSAADLPKSCQAGEEKWLLAAHGGVLMRPGHWKAEQRQAALKEILQRWQSAIQEGATAVDIVAGVIAEMEDHGIFNAGSGAIVNRAGEQELDASIMDGASQKAGAVASLRTIRNPILGAKYVMEQTRNVLFVGPAADRLLAQAGLELAQLPPPNKSQLRQTAGQSHRAPVGTVGAIARDRCGNLAAGTSTGGFDTKIPGRVGDSPIIGAGTYANDRLAVSASGHGEYFIRYAVAYDVFARMNYGDQNLSTAADAAIEQLASKGGRGGIIALDNAGQFTSAYSTAGMVRGVVGADRKLEVEGY
ncbi:isoaspartyl peptidase/L-asparaginase family protein [Rhodovibrionaceae bacterium A322]